jgi:hypothetical protein
VISRERVNGTFDIDYDDGEKEMGVESNLIRERENNSRKRRSPSPSQETTYEEIAIGTKIEARYKGGSKWFQGRITNKQSDNTYDIIYSDGDFEENVKRHMIRKKEDNVPPPIPKPEQRDKIPFKSDYDINSIIKIQRWYKRWKTKKSEDKK